MVQISIIVFRLVFINCLIRNGYVILFKAVESVLSSLVSQASYFLQIFQVFVMAYLN